MISDAHRFVYVDNVKAASTTIRALLEDALNATWFNWASRRSHLDRRDSTRDVHPDVVASYFKFSVVRDPLAKFLSGVDQARWEAPRRFHNVSYDAVTARIDAYGGENEHLESNLWRISGPSAAGRPLALDFIGRVETFEDDWPFIVSRLHNVSDSQRMRLLARAKPRNVRERPSAKGTVRRGPRALSRDALRAFCRVRRADYTCLAYPMPVECEGAVAPGPAQLEGHGFMGEWWPPFWGGMADVAALAVVASLVVVACAACRWRAGRRASSNWTSCQGRSARDGTQCRTPLLDQRGGGNGDAAGGEDEGN